MNQVVQIPRVPFGMTAEFEAGFIKGFMEGSKDSEDWEPGMSLAESERVIILKALEHHEGNRIQTAKALKICIRTLRLRLVKYREQGCEIIDSDYKNGYQR